MPRGTVPALRQAADSPSLACAWQWTLLSAEGCHTPGLKQALLSPGLSMWLTLKIVLHRCLQAALDSLVRS